MREDLPSDVATTCMLYDMNFTNFSTSLQWRFQGPTIMALNPERVLAEVADPKFGKDSCFFHIVGSRLVGDAMRELDHTRRLAKEKGFRR